MTDELDALRTELGAIDGDILKLVSRRQELARQIGRIKAGKGRGTRDFGQERVVIERARKHAAKANLDPSVAEDLLVRLIRYSLTEQERDRVATSSAGDGRRMLVIGGAGRMGRWMCRFAASQGYEVEVADPSGRVEGVTCRERWQEFELDHEVIVVAAPLRVSNEICTELATRRPDGVVFDIGSLKSPLRPGLAALCAAGVRTTSVHPMFGPDTALLSGRHVIFCDLGFEDATALATELFDSTMALQVHMDLAAHDRLIAYVLGLSHALNISFFTALERSGITSKQLSNMSSTTFDAQLDVATRVAHENPHLYYEIQAHNDFGSEAVGALKSAIDSLHAAVVSGNEAEFVELMERGRVYFDGPTNDESPT